ATTARFGIIAKQAHLPFDVKKAGTFKVVERYKGTGVTDFGVPETIASCDRLPLTGKEAERCAALLEASWVVLGRVVAHAPASLRKGPRGGGRDRDQIVEHVEGAEESYGRAIGLRIKDVNERRAAFLKAVRSGSEPTPGKGWPVRYFVRRTAWHVIDHTWEIEDKSE
nr:hypothetical protein [Candidatus Dormibacteraeota bacterium]